MVTAGEASARPRVTMAPEQPALPALAAICLALLDAVEINAAGVRGDLDAEFLHDLRVAIRRTRSMLRHARGTVPAEVRDRYGKELTWLFRVSTDLRDLDVHLLGFDELAAELPSEQRGDLEPFRALLVERRRDAHAALVTALDSARYRELVRGWRAFLEAAAATGGAGPATAPVDRLARKAIWKAYRSAVKLGRGVAEDTPAGTIHELRKRGKTLRYLLEEYGSLLRGDDIKPLVGELKKLQDVLGAFHDCEVQIARLRRYAQLLEQSRGAAAPALPALGAAVSRLAQRQEQLRAELAERFSRFDRQENRDRFGLLFGPRAEAGSPAPAGGS